MIVEVVVAPVLTGGGGMVTVGVDVYFAVKVSGMVMAYDVDLIDTGDFVA